MTVPIVKSAARTLRILEYFAVVQRPASVSEIEDVLDLPQSSTSVLLHSLAQLGYLEYLSSRRQFRPTLRVTALGEWLKLGLSIGPLAERLDELRHRTGEAVAVGQRNGVALQYIYVLPSARCELAKLVVGIRRPLSNSSSGRALLSEMNESEARKIIRRNNVEANRAGERVDEKLLIAHLRKIRETNISETNRAFGDAIGHHAISTLLIGERAGQSVSLGVMGPRARVLSSRPKICAALREFNHGESADGLCPPLSA